MEEEERRDVTRREAQQLRLRITELENARNALEKDLNAMRSIMTGEEQQAERKVATMAEVRTTAKIESQEYFNKSLNCKALEDVRLRERRLEEQRHSLELQLASTQQEVKDLTVKLTGCEGRVGELRLTAGRAEAAKRDLEGKLSTVCGILREVCLVHYLLHITCTKVSFHCIPLRFPPPRLGPPLRPR